MAEAIRDLGEVFEGIYSKEKWGKGKGSGTGSAPGYCAGWLEYLQKEIPECASVVDFGCGDHQLYEGTDLSKWDYTGLDISATALELAAARSPSADLRRIEGDSAEYLLRVLEEKKADYLLIKDVLMHWNCAEIENFLPRVAAGFDGVILTANNWRYIRTPNRPVMPRELDAYSWAPVPVDHPVLVSCGFQLRGHYPRGKIKAIMERPAK